jgi:hypothetical protein
MRRDRKKKNGTRETGNGKPVNSRSVRFPFPVPRFPFPVSRSVCLFVSLAAATCTPNINLLPRDASAGGTGGGVGSSGAAGSDASIPLDATANPPCANPGPPIVLPTDTGAACAGALAALGHRFALCSCNTMTTPARLRTEAYDSRNPGVTDEVAAAIGVGGDLIATGELRAGGAIYVAGANGIMASNQFRSSASLRVGGPMKMLSSDNAEIGSDAFINGSVSGNVRVSGMLHVATGAVLSGGVEYGTLAQNETITVPSPCDCHAGFVDIAAAIGAAAASKADAAIGLAPTALASATTPTTISLPCGSFYLSGVDATAAVTIAVHGRALLAVDGDVTVRGGLAVQLDPSAELDLLVRGQLIASGGDALGAAGGAARFRIWIGGTNTIVLDDAPAVNAIIHAPAAWVNAASGLPLSGSILARSVSIGAETMLHYDRAVLEAGTVCNAPASTVVP